VTTLPHGDVAPKNKDGGEEPGAPSDPGGQQADIFLFAEVERIGGVRYLLLEVCQKRLIPHCGS